MTKWPLRLALALALFVPPILGLLVIFLPHPISSTVSGAGLLLYPIACLGLMWWIARKTEYGFSQFFAVVVALLTSVVCGLLLLIGSIAEAGVSHH